MQKDFALREAAYKQIQPFAAMLIQAGIDPMKFLQTPQGQAMIAPQRSAISQNFEQSRVNLIDALAGSGIGGMGAGPLAALFGGEAQAQSDLLGQFLANSMNLGLQGGNLLAGQQATFNPQIAGSLGNQAAHTVINAPAGPGWGLAQSLIGAAGQAAGGALMGGSGGGSPCYIAAALYGEGSKTRLIRQWLVQHVEGTKMGWAVKFYRRYGPALAKHAYAFKWLFDRLSVRSVQWAKQFNATA